MNRKSFFKEDIYVWLIQYSLFIFGLLILMISFFPEYIIKAPVKPFFSLAGLTISLFGMYLFIKDKNNWSERSGLWGEMRKIFPIGRKSK